MSKSRVWKKNNVCLSVFMFVNFVDLMNFLQMTCFHDLSTWKATPAGVKIVEICASKGLLMSSSRHCGRRRLMDRFSNRSWERQFGKWNAPGFVNAFL